MQSYQYQAELVAQTWIVYVWPMESDIRSASPRYIFRNAVLDEALRQMEAQLGGRSRDGCPALTDTGVGGVVTNGQAGGRGIRPLAHSQEIRRGRGSGF